MAVRKEEVLEAIKDLASEYHYSFRSLYKLSIEDLDFIQKILSKSLVNDYMIKKGLSGEDKDSLTEKALASLKKKGYDV